MRLCQIFRDAIDGVLHCASPAEINNCGQYDAVICAEHRCLRPAEAGDEMAFRVCVKARQVFLLITPSSWVAAATVLVIVPNLRTL